MPDPISNLLGDFITLRVPIRASARLVEGLPALDVAHAELTPHDLTSVLQKFLAAEITGEELGLWADALNTRLGRGIHVPGPDADLVLEVVQQLAIVHGLEDDVTTTQAAEYLRRLSEVAA